jgi:two-component system NarL family sensor kinase
MPLPVVRYLFTCILLLGLCIHVKAQELGLTHIEQRPSYTAGDSILIMKRIALSEESNYIDQGKAIKQVDTAYALSLQKGFQRGIANSLIAYAVYSGNRGDYKAVDSFFKLAYPYCVRYSKASGSNHLLVLWMENASIQASYQGNYQQALSYSYKALSLLEEYKADTVLITLKIRAYNSIGSMLQYLSQTEQALAYLNTGIKLAIKHNSKNDLAQLYINTGGAYRGKKDWVTAEAYYHKAIALCKQTDTVFKLHVAYLSMAALHLNQAQEDSALVYLNKAASISNENAYMSVATPYLMMGRIYLNKKNYKSAASYGQKALDAGIKMGTKQTICDAHGLLADIYNQQKLWEPAFEHQFLYTKYKDSLVNEKVLSNINQLNTKWQVKEKDKQLAIQKLSLNLQQNRIRSKNFLLASISAFALLALFFAFFLRRNYKNKQKIQESQSEITRLKAILEGGEKERKRIAIDLHDGIVSQLMAVKMNLSTARSQQQYTNTESSADFDQSIRYLDETMQDVRITAYNLSAETVLRHGLSVALERFCESMGRNQSTEIIFQSYGNTPPSNQQLILSAYRIVQELLQNALKHAHAQRILVQLNQEQDMLAITVEDNGCGFDQDNPGQMKGMGLSNLADRVKVFNGTLSIQSSAKGSAFYIEFPY